MQRLESYINKLEVLAILLWLYFLTKVDIVNSPRFFHRQEYSNMLSFISKYN